MKKYFALIMAFFCLMNLVSCFPTDPGYGNTVAYAGWSDDPSIENGALNKELLQSQKGEHLPVFKFDTLADLEEFRSAYGNVLSLDQGYDEASSFEEVLAKAQWDCESFFEKKTLLLVYVPANSGSYRFGLFNIKIEDNSLNIYVEQTNAPGDVTDDMAGWFILVEVNDEEISSCNSFDASLIVWEK